MLKQRKVFISERKLMQIIENMSRSVRDFYSLCYVFAGSEALEVAQYYIYE